MNNSTNKNKLKKYLPLYLFALVLIISLILAYYYINNRSPIRGKNYSLKLPCNDFKKQADFQNDIYTCESEGIKYRFTRMYRSTNVEDFNLNCKTRSSGQENENNENKFYKKEFNNKEVDICIVKTDGEDGPNTGYEQVEASFSLPESTYLFKVSGPKVNYDAYSIHMENVLNTFKVKNN